MIEKWTEIVYLAGPYRESNEWLVGQNIERAKQIAAELWSCGFVVICPHLNTARFNGAYGMGHPIFIKGDLALVKVSKKLVVIPRWRFSGGTKDEIKCAEKNDIPVYYWEKEKDRYFLQHYYDLLEE
jgi:hypothetical protein